MKLLNKPAYLLFDRHFIVITVLTLGLVAGLSVLNQRTQTQQHASRVSNLNSASEIETTINPDGTMGPKTSRDDFAGSLPSAYLGNVIINIKDSQADGLVSLKLTISKAEAHLIHLFIPGDQNSERDAEIISDQKTNQNVNKWETLLLNGKSDPINIDLTYGLNNSLGITKLAGGKYSEIRLYIAKAIMVKPDGKEEILTMSGNNNIIRVVSPFNVYASKTTNLMLDLDQKSSVIEEGNVKFLIPFVSGVSAAN